ncbi:MAG: hypothetical protein AW09_002448 [Candidatus Accumulibacter phosphatis]|uniref:Uncharacterized protein n=1 Tax=Candidatus Accumulibacter phosphatis TaxID=327160 RepID=A0A080LX02_9PROT|nr:MAG: hypothetical protein AW09_002448 [Candidatus Accumulibacter phosphatis]
MDAAQDAAGPPLVVGDPLDRLESVMDAGISEDVEVQAGAHQQPELPEADRSEMIERVHLVAESDIEHVLDAHEQPAQELLQDLDHDRFQLRRLVRSAVGWVVRRKWRPHPGMSTAVVII